MNSRESTLRKEVSRLKRVLADKTEVLGEAWHLVLQHRWPTEGAAYEMEQRVLAALRTPSFIGERVSCSKQKLESTGSSRLFQAAVPDGRLAANLGAPIAKILKF